MTSFDKTLGQTVIRPELVTSIDQLMHVFALRATTFWQELDYPYALAFDQNDLQATHAVAYVDEEPVGAMRIRWFNGFAKLERTAFKQSDRGIANIKALSDFVFDHVARKGYTTVITHAAPKYARLWRTHFGFSRVSKPPAVYEGETYHELMRTLIPPSNSINLESGVEVLFRTEGRWDVPGRYETTI